MEQQQLLVYPRLVIGLEHQSKRVTFDTPVRMFTYGDLRKSAVAAFKWSGRLEHYSMHIYLRTAEQRCNPWDAFDSSGAVFFTYFGVTLPVTILYAPASPACCSRCTIL